MECWNSRIEKVYKADTPLSAINTMYTSLRAEEVAQEELEMKPGDKLMRIVHFNRENSFQIFGNSFMFVVKNEETVTELKQRLKKKLSVSDEEFKKWNLALMSLSINPQILADDFVIGSYKFDIYNYIGLEHPETARFKSNFNYSYYRTKKETAIKING